MLQVSLLSFGLIGPTPDASILFLRYDSSKGDLVFSILS